MKLNDCFILIWIENLDIKNKIDGKGDYTVNNLSLRIDNGEYVSISGLYGTDKISFIDTICCLDRPDGGKYIYDYNDITTISQNKLDCIRSSIGFLFRNLNLVEELTVYQNIELPLSISNKSNRAQAIAEASEKLELTSFMDMQVKKLTELQKHKVSLARALVVNPLLIIADEPAYNLDSADTKIILDALSDINSQGTAILCFTERKQLYEEAQRHIVFENGIIKNDIKSFINRKTEEAL